MDYLGSERDEEHEHVTSAQLVAAIEKFSTYATELSQRIRTAANEGHVVPVELSDIPAATVKLVGFLRTLKPASTYFKPQFREALYQRVLGMQRDYHGLSHHVDIWLSGQRSRKIVRFKQIYTDDIEPQQNPRPYLVSRVGTKALL